MIKKLITFLLVIYAGLNQVCLAVQNFEQLDIQMVPVSLTSKLKKDYSGYEYTVTNNKNEPVNIVNAQIKNGQDGSLAYQTSKAENAMGVTWAIAGPVGLFTLGIGWIAGLIATPIVWVVQNNKNKKIRIEAIPYTNMVPLGKLNANESFKVKTLTPIGSQPQLILTVKNEKNNIQTVIK